MTEARRIEIREKALQCKGLIRLLKTDGVKHPATAELITNLINLLLETTAPSGTPKAPPSQGEWSKDNPVWKAQD